MEITLVILALVVVLLIATGPDWDVEISRAKPISRAPKLRIEIEWGDPVRRWVWPKEHE